MNKNRKYNYRHYLLLLLLLLLILSILAYKYKMDFFISSNTIIPYKKNKTKRNINIDNIYINFKIETFKKKFFFLKIVP